LVRGVAGHDPESLREREGWEHRNAVELRHGDGVGARAREIQSFVIQIGSIADQTNLLALNAAIEAARTDVGSGRRDGACFAGGGLG